MIGRMTIMTPNMIPTASEEQEIGFKPGHCGQCGSGGMIRRVIFICPNCGRIQNTRAYTKSRED